MAKLSFNVIKNRSIHLLFAVFFSSLNQNIKQVFILLYAVSILRYVLRKSKSQCASIVNRHQIYKQNVIIGSCRNFIIFFLFRRLLALITQHFLKYIFAEFGNVILN